LRVNTIMGAIHDDCTNCARCDLPRYLLQHVTLQQSSRPWMRWLFGADWFALWGIHSFQLDALALADPWSTIPACAGCRPQTGFASSVRILGTLTGAKSE
jgi:hypothetical protein